MSVESQASSWSASESSDENAEIERRAGPGGPSQTPDRTPSSTFTTLREPTPALHHSQNVILKGERTVVEPDKHETTLVQQLEWFTDQLELPLTVDVFDSFQAAGNRVEQQLFALRNGTFVNDPDSLVQVNLNQPKGLGNSKKAASPGVDTSRKMRRTHSSSSNSIQACLSSGSETRTSHPNLPRQAKPRGEISRVPLQTAATEPLPETKTDI